MTNLLTVLYVGGLFAAAIILSSHIYRLLKAYRKVSRRRKELPYLEKATADNCCKGPHNYDESKLVMEPLPPGDYLVCKDCGFVSNSVGDYKLNGPALEVFLNNIKLRKDREAQALISMIEKQRLMDEAMNSVVRRSIQKFDGDLSKNSAELQQFFRLCVIEIEDVIHKTNKDNHG